jgi:RNA polymerase sigma factor (TIGR02999 family)
MPPITQLLASAADGDGTAARDILPLVYDELRKLAAAKLAQEQAGQTLQPTALVHEAYLRLVGTSGGPEWNHRGHFFAAAAEAMRRILVENARRKNAAKRGGDRCRVDLDEAASAEADEQLLAIDESLGRFAAVDGQAAELVKLRYFAGLTMAEAAAAMGLSERTAARLWTYARAWLRRDVEKTG